MLFTVGEMAKKLGLAPFTLRYYDKEGLLPLVETLRKWDSCVQRSGLKMPIRWVKSPSSFKKLASAS